ncbi:MAG: hypothetical protein AAF749_12730 [Pseudomonadota bacterium]
MLSSSHDPLYKSVACVILSATLVLPGCGQRSQSDLASSALVEVLASPAASGSELSRVTSDNEGRVYLSWVDARGGRAELLFAQLRGDTWQEPESVASGTDWFLNWADFPALAVQESAKAVHWLRRSGEGTYDYDILARFYHSEAGEWSEPIQVNQDQVSAEHGFVSMLPLAQGRTMLSWLDGRYTKSSPTAGPMSLRSAIFDPLGQAEAEWELDSRVCDCCQTNMALTSNGPVVVYRDRSASEVRDIAITRLLEGRWTMPKTIHEDGWEVQGCPVNGPAVAASGPQVAVAWFTARDDLPQVKVAFSSDSGASFSAPSIVAKGNTNGRVALAHLSTGDFAVTWIDTSEAGTTIMLTRFTRNGELIESVPVAKTTASRRSGFPSMVAHQNSVFISWTAVDASAYRSQVQVARVRFP